MENKTDNRPTNKQTNNQSIIIWNGMAPSQNKNS